MNQRIALNLATNFGTMFSGARVSVKSPTNTTVVAPIVVGTNGAFVEPVTLTAAGTYTVKVDPDGANTGNVTLNLYTVPNDVSSAITAGGAGVARGQHRAGPEHEAHVHGHGRARRSASS